MVPMVMEWKSMRAGQMTKKWMTIGHLNGLGLNEQLLW
jgi:hypothetical protein